MGMKFEINGSPSMIKVKRGDVFVDTDGDLCFVADTGKIFYVSRGSGEILERAIDLDDVNGRPGNFVKKVLQQGETITITV